MHLGLFETVLVAGVVQAGLYGFLPISIILSYRVSRTIAFVHGGIAAAAALTYWLLALDNQFLPDYIIDMFGRHGHRPVLDPLVALVFTAVLGAVIGGVYGVVMMSRRIAAQSILTLTVISLGVMVCLVGAFGLLNIEPNVIPPSPFGEGKHLIRGVYLTDHKLITLSLVGVLSLVLALLLTRTHLGLLIRALADDQEAGIWCGVPLRRVGTIVYAGSGAIAALAGVLIAVTAGPDPDDMIVLYLNGLAIAVVGGLRSLPMAFCGALMFGLLEMALNVGFPADVPDLMRPLILYGAVLAAIVVAAKLRREDFFLLDRQSL